MKKLIASIALAACAASASAVPCTSVDKWTGQDKTKHFAVGVAAGSMGTLAFNDPHKAFAFGVALSAAKEVYDRRSPAHTCSFQDFAVTALGAAAGAYGTAWIVTPNFVGYARRF